MIAVGDELYPAIKLLHVGCAIISISGFTLRGVLKLTHPEVLQSRWLRIAPHINDSILLGCAIYLAYHLQQFPGTADWLTAKLVGLIIYIVLGMAVLRFAKTQTQRLLAFIAALLCFGYIVAVALSRNPWPFS